MIASAESQESQILAALQAGIRITPAYALKHFGCFRLSGRIHALRKRLGIAIESHLVKTETGKHVAEYRLAAAENPTS